ncbi:MAG TPA: GNAT family protein [Spongiibacteraceae bacterium]|nr:GNAT family protein [Spongiibacteraceae bacterium]
MDIEKVVLEGLRVRLEPLAQQHAAGLAAVIEDGELWKIPVTVVPHPNDLDKFFDAAETAFQQRRELAFVTIDKISGAIVGSTRFRCIEAAHKRLEIGFTFIAQSRQRSYINTEAKYLMLRHAFEIWQCNRVELLTDVLNEKSRNAITRIGAQQEGILRSHMIMRDGRVRDSVLFSIVAHDWPTIKPKLAQQIQR